MWYGVSNIAARLLTYVLTPYLTYFVFNSEAGKAEFGRYSFVYLLLPLLNVVYTYGMETAYFRYSQSEDHTRLYRTQISAILLTTLFFSGLLWLFELPLARFANLERNPEYVMWSGAIVGLDAITALPFARLRRENKPRKYALIKVAGIVVFVGVILVLFSIGKNPSSLNPALAYWLDRHWGTGFILFANILQALTSLALLSGALREYRPAMDLKLIRQLLPYSLPILITGFAGSINDNLNRVMFDKLYPAVDPDAALKELGEFTAAVRLSILINLSIQAFKMAAEPFFFSISQNKNAPETYARIMKWFVIVLCLMYLLVALFMDVWKYFVGEEYRDALSLVPVLLLSYVFLGIYYNLTVWYKLTDRTQYGMYIMLIGSVFTIVFNALFIPAWGYAACAWGALLCYGLMMVLSYAWGQRFFPIPYATKRMLTLLGGVVALTAAATWASARLPSAGMRLLLGSVLMAIYILFLSRLERQEFKAIASMVRQRTSRARV